MIHFLHNVRSTILILYHPDIHKSWYTNFLWACGCFYISNVTDILNVSNIKIYEFPYFSTYFMKTLTDIFKLHILNFHGHSQMHSWMINITVVVLWYDLYTLLFNKLHFWGQNRQTLTQKITICALDLSKRLPTSWSPWYPKQN